MRLFLHPILATAFAMSVAALWAAPVPKESLVPKIADTAEATAAPGDDAARLANEKASMQNLKMFGIAVHEYAGANGDKLPQNISDRADKALLSWRVLLLPYLGENDLYRKFKLDEPWDSANNIKLLEKMPDAFVSPRVKVKKGYTVYQGFSGNGAFFGCNYTIATIPDGTSNTILCVESTAAVPWTKPVDIAFDRTKDLPDFGKAFGAKPFTVLCDGSVRDLDLKKISAATLKDAITTDDGNVLGQDW